YADSKWATANTETEQPANTEKAPPMNTDEAAPVISLPEFSAVADSIECTLLDMLDKMTLSSAAEKELETLRATIDAGLNWYELAAVLEQLGGLVLQVLDRDHGDIEKFLQGLNERLADVNEQLQRASQRHEIFADHTEQFTVELRNDIDALQAELDEEKAIDTLKDAVSTQVEQMSDRLNQYNEEQQEHAQELTSEISRLQEKIKTLETEAKENQRLLAEQVEKSLLDALTQLPNREAYDERITTEFARWQRYRRPLSLAVVDVDHFKSVNDNYGHMAGDNVLRILANTLTKRLRRTDYIARYGGEEFVILMPETGLADAMHVMEQVREKVAETPFHFKSEPLTITVSCGLASFNEGDSIEQVFERADEQLYAAKNGGRNQCRAA
ncbi:diguanylate cyclase, partial [bacterium]|nr:diguanylate cyclase [bacterium]